MRYLMITLYTLIVAILAPFAILLIVLIGIMDSVCILSKKLKKILWRTEM